MRFCTSIGNAGNIDPVLGVLVRLANADDDQPERNDIGDDISRSESSSRA